MKEFYKDYTEILKEELVPAMGCTEPIALAYAGAKARSVLGELPERIVVEASGSIIKNVKSVIVPHTDHMKGIPAAVIAGVVAGDEEKELEALSDVSEDDIQRMHEYSYTHEVEVRYLDSPHVFDLIVEVFSKENKTRVHICDYHTNIVEITKNDEVIYKSEECQNAIKRTDRRLLNMENIWDYINHVDLDDIREVLERQMNYNSAISNEGLTNNYGANIGKVLMNTHPDCIEVRAKAVAAAGSDARMNGCELPVVINSGSGNQGMTCSLPVIEYARYLEVSNEKMLRALALSNLVTIHEKTPIGTLSAYCGAVSAGAGAGAGIAYLQNGDYKTITHTVVNALAITSGMICDGAKASCAAKIASSVEAGILGYNMYKQGQQFKAGDGIVKKGVENTIASVGKIGRDGMKETNKEIISIMLEE